MQEWYDEHLVQFRKDSADLSMVAADDEASANAAYAELKSGVAFADVAAKYSTDPRTKATGGSLGNMDLSGLPPQIVQAVDSIPEGETLSSPVNMGQGFMILKVENRQQSVTPFEEVKDQIQETALKETAQEVVKELREKANVEFPAEIAATPATPAVPTTPEVKTEEAPEGKTEEAPEEKTEAK